MKINVKGTGIEYYTPNQIELNLTFQAKANTQKEALQKGTESLEKFIEKVLLPMNFFKEELKTRNIIVREEQKYNEITHKYEFDGYSYNQIAKLDFDYDKERLAAIIEETSKLENAPFYHINFGIKNKQEAKNKAIQKAYQDAKLQAQAIADASSTKLIECKKVDYQPIIGELISRSNMESDTMLASESTYNLKQEIINTFTPEDIEITETIYCEWIAE